MASFQVHYGSWNDRSHHSSFSGSTITLPIQYSNYLVSALAVAVTIGASCLWVVIAFILHQVIVTEKNTDHIGLQHQVILRNSPSPLGTLWELVKVCIAWRRTKARRLTRRSLAVAIPALLVWGTFTAASILVANVASKSFGQIQVLIEQNDCGFWQYEDNGFNRSTVDGSIGAKFRKDATNAQIYARSWYGNSLKSLNAQSLFPTTALAFQNSTTAPCPVAEARCALGPNSAFSLQTDILDSHLHLGINAPKKDRILFQKNLTCSVLSVDDLARLNGTILEFFLGPRPGSGDYEAASNAFDTSLTDTIDEYRLR
jgi:hypothetical protein